MYNNTSTSNVDLFQLRSDVGSTNNIKLRVDSDGDIFTDGSTTLGTPADVAEKYGNTDGAVVIPAGATEATVTFEASYGQMPKVTASANGFVLVKVDEKSVNSFKVKIQAAQTEAVSIDWIALEPAE